MLDNFHLIHGLFISMCQKDMLPEAKQETVRALLELQRRYILDAAAMTARAPNHTIELMLQTFRAYVVHCSKFTIIFFFFFFAEQQFVSVAEALPPGLPGTT